MTTQPNKVLRLKIAARVKLLAFEIRSDLTCADLDNDMAVVYTKAALIELGYGEDADTELAMRLMLEAAKVHVPKRAFSPGGVVLPVNQKQLFSGQYQRIGEDVEYIIKPNFKQNAPS